MNLTKREKEILINIKGELTGQLYNGRFKIRRVLTQREEFLADLRRRSILGPNPENALVQIVDNAYTLGQLSARIVDWPTWWNPNDDEVGGLDLMDVNVVAKIFEECVKAETDWKEEVSGKAEEAEVVVKKTAKKKVDIPEDGS